MENVTMYQPARRAALLHSTETSPTADIITPQIPSIYNKVKSTKMDFKINVIFNAF